MEELRNLLLYLNNPTIRMALVGVTSLSVSGIYMYYHGMSNTKKFDTITDLKKKAKAFTKVNYQQKTNSKL